ncbi:CRP-like cAMP-binding protein [Nocardiopsis mwathae]|uniref:CRP-like cAMP-binding protein n=1 Tax=Nocardiopsis mwathae TaxID=1472723 RepID=A0A7W9YMA2_9ACTN|nr:Crp/Fnr family transcriptional regulator [Nocardiopsis mwathae]MBB6174599.1 CRP-like cAMP-binding protein [Nocardiopsis mwathae]
MYNGTWPAGTFMSRLGEAARADLLGLTQTRTYPTGTALLRQGHVENTVYVLRSSQPGDSACVKVTSRLPNGVETLLAVRVSGDVVGEMGPLRGSAPMATVTTCSPTIAQAIPTPVFMNFLDRNRDAWGVIGSVLGDRLEWAERRRTDFAVYEVPVRLARVLVDLVDRHGAMTDDGLDLGVRLSQAELGRLIGAREDAVGQAVRRLREDGYIRSRYRKVTVIDLDGLRAFADLV